MENMTRCQQAIVAVHPAPRALAPMAIARPWSVKDGLVGATSFGNTTVNDYRRPPEAPS